MGVIGANRGQNAHFGALEKILIPGVQGRAMNIAINCFEVEWLDILSSRSAKSEKAVIVFYFEALLDVK